MLIQNGHKMLDQGESSLASRERTGGQCQGGTGHPPCHALASGPTKGQLCGLLFPLLFLELKGGCHADTLIHLQGLDS